MRPYDERMKTLLMALARDPDNQLYAAVAMYITVTYRPRLLRGRERFVAAILAVIAMRRLMMRGNSYGTITEDLD